MIKTYVDYVIKLSKTKGKLVVIIFFLLTRQVNVVQNYKPSNLFKTVKITFKGNLNPNSKQNRWKGL